MPNVEEAYISSYSYGLWCQKLYAPISSRIVNHNACIIIIIINSYIYKCSAVHTNLCLIQYRRPRRRLDS